MVSGYQDGNVEMTSSLYSSRGKTWDSYSYLVNFAQPARHIVTSPNIKSFIRFARLLCLIRTDQVPYHSFEIFLHILCCSDKSAAAVSCLLSAKKRSLANTLLCSIIIKALPLQLTALAQKIIEVLLQPYRLLQT